MAVTRANGGTVSFWYELIRPDRAFKTAVQSALAQIKDATGFMILQGTLSGCAGS